MWLSVVLLNAVFISYARGQTVVDYYCSAPSCYTLYTPANGAVTWQDAFQACQDSGQRMAIIQNLEAQITLKRMRKDSGSDGHAWVAGRRSDDVTWRDVNGTETSVVTAVGDWRCSVVHFDVRSTSHITITSWPCLTEAAPFKAICQYHDMQQRDGEIWRSNDKQYLMTSQSFQTWNEARQYCINNNGDLAYADVMDVRWRSHFWSGNQGMRVWVGFCRNCWKWKIGQMEIPMHFTNWEENEGSNINDNCLHLDLNQHRINSWADKPCGDNSGGYICEKENEYGTPHPIGTTLPTPTTSTIKPTTSTISPSTSTPVPTRPLSTPPLTTLRTPAPVDPTAPTHPPPANTTIPRTTRRNTPTTRLPNDTVTLPTDSGNKSTLPALSTMFTIRTSPPANATLPTNPTNPTDPTPPTIPPTNATIRTTRPTSMPTVTIPTVNTSTLPNATTPTMRPSLPSGGSTPPTQPTSRLPSSVPSSSMPPPSPSNPITPQTPPPNIPGSSPPTTTMNSTPPPTTTTTSPSPATVKTTTFPPSVTPSPTPRSTASQPSTESTSFGTTKDNQPIGSRSKPDFSINSRNFYIILLTLVGLCVVITFLASFYFVRRNRQRKKGTKVTRHRDAATSFNAHMAAGVIPGGSVSSIPDIKDLTLPLPGAKFLSPSSSVCGDDNASIALTVDDDEENDDGRSMDSRLSIDKRGYKLGSSLENFSLSTPTSPDGTLVSCLKKPSTSFYERDDPTERKLSKFSDERFTEPLFDSEGRFTVPSTPQPSSGFRSRRGSPVQFRSLRQANKTKSVQWVDDDDDDKSKDVDSEDGLVGATSTAESDRKRQPSPPPTPAPGSSIYEVEVHPPPEPTPPAPPTTLPPPIEDVEIPYAMPSKEDSAQTEIVKFPDTVVTSTLPRSTVNYEDIKVEIENRANERKLTERDDDSDSSSNYEDINEVRAKLASRAVPNGEIPTGSSTHGADTSAILSHESLAIDKADSLDSSDMSATDSERNHADSHDDDSDLTLLDNEHMSKL